MRFIEKIKEKCSMKYLGPLINAYLITISVTTTVSKEKISSIGFLYNGISLDNFSYKLAINNFAKFILFFIVTIVVSLLVITYIQKRIKTIKFQYVLLLINVFIYAIINAYKDQANINFLIAIALIILCVFYYVFIKKKAISFERVDISEKHSYIVLMIGALLYLLIVGGLTILRYVNYHQNIFDTSIFCQMYYYMSKTLIPYTTVERQRLMSHFAVHFAPIYYILLPGFVIFKSPIYLAFMKTLMMASPIVPLYKLSKNKGLSNLFSVILALTYLVFPMLIASNIGDGNGHILNENYFYPAFLLWLFYFIEKKNYRLVWVFSILTLLVKEDAPIIIASISLYLIFSKKAYYHGKRLFIVAVLYFITCTYLIMPLFGQEVLIASYYSNFILNNGSAFPSILYAFIFKPTYALEQIFTQDKLQFLIELLGPLLFLPILALKNNKTVIVLTIPIILTSLLCKNPTYIYEMASHHNMTPVCIIFFLTILALSSIKSKNIQIFLISTCFCLCTVFTVSYNGNKINEIKFFMENKENILLMDKALNRIPEDASVAASSSLSTKLTNRRYLYLYNRVPCDYEVLDLRNQDNKTKQSVRDMLTGNEYGVFDYKKDLFLILSKDSSTEKNEEILSEQFK